jgi:glycogen operon protein
MLGGPKDLAWLHPSGREMTPEDWHDEDLRVVSMFVSGAPLRSPGPRGEQQVDRSFLIYLNSGAEPELIDIPEQTWVQSGEVVLSTDEKLPVGLPVKVGDRLSLGSRSVLVLRQT